MATAEAADTTVWVDAEKEYQLALADGKLVCKNPKGKQLASVPKWLKESEQAQQMLAVAEWLEEHRQQCMATVEAWMLRSLPAPLEVLQSVWPDDAWRGVLQNLVVAAVDKDGAAIQDKSGFLRDVDDKGRIGVVDLDGETQWLKTAAIAVPHPILLDELEDYRELAAELGFEQQLTQLFRETWKATEEQAKAKKIDEFENGKFEMLMHALGLCRRLGYRVKGGNAICPVWENGQLVEARYWVGADYPESETFTGELVFVDGRDRAITIGDLGPVSFSEGMRMASAIFAKRVVEKEEDDE